VLFSRRCPLCRRGLSPLHRLLYTNGTWSYFANVATSVIFGLIPFNSLVLGLHPCTFSVHFAAASMLHLVTGQLLTGFCREPGQMRSMWLAAVSNHVLCFTFLKAIVNTLL
jgi:hypothetical protein